jgi:hypothetical protein
MAKKQSTIELIRYLLEHGGKTRYQISMETGVDQAALCRILKGRVCSTETADKILDLFGYEITKKKGRAK